MPDPNKTNRSETTPSGTPTPGRPAHPAKPTKVSIQAPKGTRDLYPDDANLRRFITEAWRNASIRHGFEEIDGPTFEDADLYKVKSGDGILAEMFGVYSGKSPEDVAAVRDPERGPPYALRPEFTPTLARMYAARAAQLGKPTKWFTAGPFFRAERPQRGRLREFLQWNVDFIGLGVAQDSDLGSKVAQVSNLGSGGVAQDSVLSSGAARPDQPAAPEVRRLSEPASLPPSSSPPAPGTFQSPDPLAEARARADAECIVCCIEMLRSLGLDSSAMKVRISDRTVIRSLLYETSGLGDGGVDEEACLDFLDRRGKLTNAEQEQQAADLHLSLDVYDLCRSSAESKIRSRTPWSQTEWQRKDGRVGAVDFDYRPLLRLIEELHAIGVADWCVPDLSIIRGLAYYTGMVFEVIADGERAVAGGGRYDNLIELFGGPPTPAVGFGMGDVVLTNLLRDKGLLPGGATLLDKLSQTPASLRPDAFVLTADESLDPLVRQLVAGLRRGSDAARPLHARHSYKSTRNVGKLLKEAASQHARVAIIIENATSVTLKPLDGGEQFTCPLGEVTRRLASLLA